ncbi:hypothetical protein [Nonomuraea endophytica]|uniref:hypothetical protein n=1 Tax=Nonomuraea endophytica TaxID=714136 RepID=UPI0037C90EAC
MDTQLHREQDDKTRFALTQERARIARELHDIVALRTGWARPLCAAWRSRHG